MYYNVKNTIKNQNWNISDTKEAAKTNNTKHI